MRKVALVLAIAVFLPSLVLAWLSFRSLRDQEFLIQRQRSLLYQGIADDLAKSLAAAVLEQEKTLAAKVTSMLLDRTPLELAISFDDELRRDWPLANVAFIVTTSGKLLSPSPFDRSEAKLFCADNSRFLANRESAEVYLNPKQVLFESATVSDEKITELEADKGLKFGGKSAARSVLPQSTKVIPGEDPQASKVSTAEAEFRQLIGEQTAGTITRFVDNKLNLILWFRPPLADWQKAGKPLGLDREQFVFGAQLSVPKLVDELRPLLRISEVSLRDEICAALLDDTARPLAVSRQEFTADWKHPFVSSEIGQVLPHWEVAVYLINPARLTESARTLSLTVGTLIGFLLLAITIGSWFIVKDLNRHLRIARQKTDFVSNVSHELKTPLTSIRMFSDLLAEGQVSDPAKQRSYSAIISAETARLTRLINNVLDFSGMENGAQNYNFADCEVVGVLRETVESYRAKLEASGFSISCDLPADPVFVRGDRDRLAQVFVNLLSNAEKYSGNRKEIEIRVSVQKNPEKVEISIEDRGLGVPAGCSERIFEKFYRAHDALNSGIQGSGLGLTLARQIARVHGGDLRYTPRFGGGSCFSLTLALVSTPAVHPNNP